MNIRVANKNDMSQIIEVANKSFASVRENGFDFRSIMPKAYGEGIDSSRFHYVVEEDGEIVSLLGNLPYKISLCEDYEFSIIGTVSTLPEYKNRGYMSKLMNIAMEDSKQKGYVFSLLTGHRFRYAHYGFEKFISSCEFVFEKYFKTHSACDNIVIREYNAYDLDELYSLYISNNPLIVRPKDEFVNCLKTSAAKIFVFTQCGVVKGYYCFVDRKGFVGEFVYSGENVGAAVCAILNYHNLNSIRICVSALNQKLCRALDSIAENKFYADKQHVFVYDWERFLKMLAEINQRHKGISNTIEQVVIDKAYTIKVENGHVTIDSSKAEKERSPQEFIRQSIAVAQGDDQKLLPFVFGLEEADLF